jgi:hypothetical protein
MTSGREFGIGVSTLQQIKAWGDTQLLQALQDLTAQQ